MYEAKSAIKGKFLGRGAQYEAVIDPKCFLRASSQNHYFMPVSGGQAGIYGNNSFFCCPSFFLFFVFSKKMYTKAVTLLAILYADRRDRRKSPGVPGAAIVIFADRRDPRIKSPISGMSDIGD